MPWGERNASAAGTVHRTLRTKSKRPRSAATGRRRLWPSSLAPSLSSQRPSDTAIGVSRHENGMKTKTGGRLGTGSRRGARPRRVSAWLGGCTGVRVRGPRACVTAAARRTLNGLHWKHGHPRATSRADPSSAESSCVRRRLCSGRWQVAPSACHTAGDQTNTRPAISADAPAPAEALRILTECVRFLALADFRPRASKSPAGKV